MAANFEGWENDITIFNQQVGKVIKALNVTDFGRDRSPHLLR